MIFKQPYTKKGVYDKIRNIIWITQREIYNHTEGLVLKVFIQ